MEPSQLTHLKEAAADIRRNLEHARRTTSDIERTMENAFQLGVVDGDLMMIERALTRIDMCLKEIK